jgi:CRISPR-associated protein Csx1
LVKEDIGNKKLVSKTLLIAPIGDPTSYKEARYKLNKEIDSCISFLAHDADHAIIIGLSSIVDTEIKEKKEESKCMKIMKEILSNVSPVNSYKELQEVSERALREFIERIFQETYQEYNIKKDFIILPALGKPGKNYMFKFEPATISSLLLIQLYNKVKNDFYDRIIVDLTHGINYLPAVCYIAALQIAQIMLIRALRNNVSQIRFEAYNSDPFKKDELLNINLTSERKIQTIADNLIEFLASKQPLIKKGKDFNELAKIFDEINARKGEVERLLKSLEYPYPLALSYLCNSFNLNLEEVLNNLATIFLDSVKYENNIFSSEIFIDPGKTFLLILANEIVNYVKGIAKLYEGKGFELDAIENLASLYKLVIPSYEYLIKHEISKIKEKLKDEDHFKGILEELYKEEKEVEKVDKRIMIAHAGLQKQFVHVIKEYGKIYLAYYYGKVLELRNEDVEIIKNKILEN